ncbi:MAG: PAS domain-containing methyl-accepting chemotaxis protein [Pigmentiphaga sp.]|uniref:methyl-accepting chemotaxis protein n=1 Tax=Pigmentiphaga sp. TaxID=1977564 RepID=UPI0029BAE493|nr:PAS domain-containing methyl-accepting chemotaxis protein [Pigmentiphaga sp.]MDX3904757.1 PAS domain-containing methyl-accepting chemotaxis protein [Pigmentiphaga sp.]
MRKNLPITSLERFVEKNRPVVTTTDLKGRITYANPAFIEVSGFSRDELIGQPHNIVRHPDMPPEAFADLWETLKRGQPWRALVKNRCKDGGFYWVEAYVTPLTENGRPVGYMSVRNAPDRDEVAAAQALYAEVAQGKATFPATPRPRWWHHPTPWGAGVAVVALGAVLGEWLLPHWGWMLAQAGAVGAAVAVWRLRVAGPLRRIEKTLAAIGEGTLSVPIEGRHQFDLGGLPMRVESTRIHLRSTLCDVLQVAREVEASAARVDGEIASIRKVIDEQRDRLGRIASAVEQMSVAIREASQHTSTALSLSESALNEVDTAEAKIGDSVRGTHSVAEAVGRTNEQIGSLHDLVSTISGVTQAISEIASQTRLLSLNAAIEAARAGENGRGFGVVAEEVRTLSDRTAGSTGDIGHALEAITRFATETSASMQQAVTSVQYSGEQIRESAGFFERVRRSSSLVVERARNIAGMLQQQSSASKEVAESMEGISGEVERTSDSVASLAQATDVLKSTVGDMRQSLARYETSLYH